MSSTNRCDIYIITGIIHVCPLSFPGEVLNVLGHHPGKRQVQHDRRLRERRVGAVRDIGSESDIAHRRRGQHAIGGRPVADREDADRVRREQKGRHAGAGIGTGKVSVQYY